MNQIKYTIEFPPELSSIINDFIFNFQELYVNIELIERNNAKKIRLTFETNPEMKEYFIYKLNQTIKQT